MPTALPHTNRDLFLPYALPYALYVVLAIVPAEVLDRAASYGLRIGLVGAALWWGRRHYVALRGPHSPVCSAGIGLLAGLLGALLWIALVLPFDPPERPTWNLLEWSLRTAAAVGLVPIFEELLMRGYVLRLAVQSGEARQAGATHPLATALDARNIFDVAPGSWTVSAVATSTLLFTAGHGPHEWVAAFAYGVLMAGLWVLRGDLLTCVVAHAATNLALALAAVGRVSWAVW